MRGRPIQYDIRISRMRQYQQYVNNHGQDQSAHLCTLILAMGVLFVTRVEMHIS